MSSEHGHHPAPLSDVEARTRALESILLEKGLLTPDAVDKVIAAYERDIGPLNGARVVARAWVDAAYKKRLLTDATPAIAELGFGGRQGEHMVVVENTPTIHNVIVCTLCSCYPWPVLGLPPVWYKSPPLFLLSVAGTRAAACLVQVPTLPVAGGDRAEEGVARVRLEARRGDRDQGLGQQCRYPLHGPSGAPSRN